VLDANANKAMNTDTQFKATIGLDWADQKHDLWIQPEGSQNREHTVLEQTPEALHLWVAKIRERFQNGPVAIAVETSRGPIISALMAYDFIVIYPVNPKALKDYRGVFAVSGAKDDRTDAQLLEELLRLHRDRLRALKPDDELTRKLGGFNENRRAIVDQRTVLVNQLHATLKTYYPLAKELIGREMNTPMAAEFLARWPYLASLQAARPQTIREFFYKHNSRSEKRMEARLQAIKNAQPLTTDPALIQPATALVLALVGMLKAIHQAVAGFDRAIQQIMDQHPDAPIFRSLPGAGPALAPRLLVAFGTQRDRFESAEDVAQFYGIAPVVVESGNSRTVHIRRRCPKFGRQTFHENAACAFKTERWARGYYEHQREKHEDKHHQACRALAYKLIRIYFACWKNRTQYNSDKYVAALKLSGSPHYRNLNKVSGE
jgi:transposase